MGLALFLLLCLLLAWLGGVLTVHRILTRPPRRTYASAVARNRPGDPSELNPSRTFESWTFATRGLTLPVWDIAGDNPAGPIAILSHGWGDSRLGALTRLPLLLPHCSRLIAWDMPAHGEAPGTSTLGTHEVADLLALIEHVKPTRPLILFGWSLGAGVSIAAAASMNSPTLRAGSAPDSRPLGILAVVAEAPYRLPVTPAHNMLGALRWPRIGLLAPALLLASLRAPLLGRPREFDRASLAASLPCALLILHPRDDEICPLADAQAIAAAAQHPASRLEAISGAFHNDLWHSPARLAQGESAIRALLAMTAR